MPAPTSKPKLIERHDYLCRDQTLRRVVLATRDVVHWTWTNVTNHIFEMPREDFQALVATDVTGTELEETVKTAEAAEILGVLPGTLANWRSHGLPRWYRDRGIVLPYIKRNGFVGYRRADLERFKTEAWDLLETTQNPRRLMGATKGEL